MNNETVKQLKQAFLLAGIFFTSYLVGWILAILIYTFIS